MREYPAALHCIVGEIPQPVAFDDERQKQRSLAGIVGFAEVEGLAKFLPHLDGELFDAQGPIVRVEIHSLLQQILRILESPLGDHPRRRIGQIFHLLRSRGAKVAGVSCVPRCPGVSSSG